MKKLKLGAILIALTLILSSCALKLSEGVCVDKRHREAYTSRWMQKVGHTYIWHNRKHPETWKIQVEGTTESGKDVTEWWTVTKEEFDATDIGEWVIRKE